jgi:hypothetical protein
LFWEALVKKAAAISSVLDVPGLPASPFGETGSPSVTVPAGKHLVVETVSVQVDVTPPGSQLAEFVNFICGGKSVQLFVPLTSLRTGFDFVAQFRRETCWENSF